MMEVLVYPYKVATEFTDEMKEDKEVLGTILKELVSKSYGDKITSINTRVVDGKEIIQVTAE